ncbi:hypothetical protein SUGI_0773060 [Cryptomeria japonica]|uniref:uncharacterized protein LOC131044370 n=1 Tax=Cryptomeria japonica TaxID=3369 RepID=UPI0024148E57|nr:uncharacterized protein LOC131044370 [Cryptomeria japonica]GLJ37977.1 hypothetical protein SUGI_0773060 [Cryptomeria japonica]
MSRKMMRKLRNTANFGTASLLADRERPREIEGPPLRQFCRLIVSLAALMGFALVVTMSLLNQPPKRSHRLWITPHDYHNASQFFDKMAPQLNSAEWNCPCKTSNTLHKHKTLDHIVDFFLLRERKEPLHIKSFTQVCSVLNDSSDFSGFNESCNEILRGGFQWGGWSTHSSNTLYPDSMRTSSLNPVAFMYDVCMSWAGGLSQASLSFLVSHFGMRMKTVHQLEKFGKLMQATLRTCSLYSSWPPPNEDLYVQQVKAAHPNLTKIQMAIAIKFNWTEYMAVCSPSYCEHLKMNSLAWNLFTALAQMGGFISVAVFILRAVIWPVICLVGGWPSTLTSGYQHLWVDQFSSPTPSFHTGLKRSRTVTF